MQSVPRKAAENAPARVVWLESRSAVLLLLLDSRCRINPVSLQHPTPKKDCDRVRELSIETQTFQHLFRSHLACACRPTAGGRSNFHHTQQPRGSNDRAPQGSRLAAAKLDR